MALSSDPHVWLRPIYAQLKTGPFLLLAPALQWDALCRAVEVEHPRHAADLREWSPGAQFGLLKWLKDITDQETPVDRIELWRVRKGNRELVCLAVYLPIGVDLRLMEADGFRRTQLMKDAPAVIAQSDGWRRALRERGWVEMTSA